MISSEKQSPVNAKKIILSNVTPRIARQGSYGEFILTTCEYIIQYTENLLPLQ
jgi:hypothetical protein